MAVTSYLWDPIQGSIAQIQDGMGAVASITTLPMADPLVISITANGATNFLHCDTLGDVIALSNNLQVTIGLWSYSTFGVITESSGTAPGALLFRGQLGYFSYTNVNRYESQDLIASTTTGRLLSISANTSGEISTYIAFRNRPTLLRRAMPAGVLWNGDWNMQINVRALNREWGNGRCVAGLYFQEWHFEITALREQGFVDANGAEQIKYIAHNAPCTGYIVQKVTATCHANDCTKDVVGSAAAPFPFSYYEAWGLAEKSKLVKRRGLDYTDRAQLQLPLPEAPIDGGPSLGSVSQVGEIRFYCALYKPPGSSRTVEDIISDWRPNRYGSDPCALSTAELRSIPGDTAPAFWPSDNWSIKKEDDRIYGPAPADRSFAMTWNCCGCNSVTNVIAAPTVDPTAPRPRPRPRR